MKEQTRSICLHPSKGRIIFKKLLYAQNGKSIQATLLFLKNHGKCTNNLKSDLILNTPGERLQKTNQRRYLACKSVWYGLQCFVLFFFK